MKFYGSHKNSRSESSLLFIGEGNKLQAAIEILWEEIAGKLLRLMKIYVV
jgi:hypothetical protein